jgi:hypothetical protein
MVGMSVLIRSFENSAYIYFKKIFLKKETFCTYEIFIIPWGGGGGMKDLHTLSACSFSMNFFQLNSFRIV